MIGNMAAGKTHPSSPQSIQQRVRHIGCGPKGALAILGEAAGFWRHLEAADGRDQKVFFREWAQSGALDEGADETSLALAEHATASPRSVEAVAWL